MNADRLLAHYERMADAPDAIARLRRFILDLAVRGKLVEQDPNDEPAAELLGVISSTREEMVKASKAKRPKRLLPIADEDVLYDVPKSWSWAQANDLWDFENGDRGKNYPSRDQLVQRGIPFVNAGHLVNGRVSMFQMNFITPEKYQQLGGGKLKKGDQLYCLRGSLGKHAIYDHEGEGAIASSLVILRPIEQQCVPYLSIYLESNIAGQMLRRFDNGSAQPNLSSANLRKYEIPLPPLAEQHRIVAKVDELMALCDRLEAARTERESTRDQLSAASLVRLNAPDLDPVVFRNHAAFALENLVPLTTRTDQIKSLRQTILNLAVRGKLVKQNPNDEPASELLKRRKIAVSSAMPFELPASWAWVNVGAVAVRRLGKMLDKAKNKGTPRRYLRNINVRWFDFDLSDLLEMRFEDSELSEFTLQFGDVLICEGGEPGRAAVWDGREDDIYFQKAIHRVRFLTIVDSGFFVKALRASADDGRLAEYFTGTGIKHFTGTSLAAYLFPLPPFPEQHRIITRVDELIALCDRLEASLATGEDTRRRLLDALLREVLMQTADRASVVQRPVW